MLLVAGYVGNAWRSRTSKQNLVLVTQKKKTDEIIRDFNQCSAGRIQVSFLTAFREVFSGATTRAVK